MYSFVYYCVILFFHRINSTYELEAFRFSALYSLSLCVCFSKFEWFSLLTNPLKRSQEQRNTHYASTPQKTYLISLKQIERLCFSSCLFLFTLILISQIEINCLHEWLWMEESKKPFRLVLFFPPGGGAGSYLFPFVSSTLSLLLLYHIRVVFRKLGH